MPVPTWDCPELVLLDDGHSVDTSTTTTTVVSEDIWKKFDLDFPQPLSFSNNIENRCYGGIEDGIIPDPYDHRSIYLGGGSSSYEKFGFGSGFGLGSSSSSMSTSSPSMSSMLSSSPSRIEAREIRHHDCMWAGLCISKEHNRTHPGAGAGAGVKNKKDTTLYGSNLHMKKNNSAASVPAGRSLLINRKQLLTTGGCNSNNTSTSSRLIKNLESDGDSTRPETPQSCESESEEEEEEEGEEEEEEEESEEEMPRFKHDSISINEKLSEYLITGSVGDCNNPSIAAPVSEVTGQLIVSRKTLGFNKKNYPSINNPATTKRQKQQFNNSSTANDKNNHRHLYRNNNNSNKYINSTTKKDNNHSNNGSVKNDFYNPNKNSNNNNNNSNKNNNLAIGSGALAARDKDLLLNNKNKTNYNNAQNNTTNIVSLGDHCYHLNNQTNSSSKKLEHLGVQTPSDSEEEIDVVTFDKPSNCKQATSLPTNPSFADKQHLQKTVTSALKDNNKTPPRPRGRPPSTNTPRKRPAQCEQKPAKRPKQRTSYQKRNKPGNSTINSNKNNKTVNSNNDSNNNSNSKNNHRSIENCNSRIFVGTDYKNLLENHGNGGGDGSNISCAAVGDLNKGANGDNNRVIKNERTDTSSNSSHSNSTSGRGTSQSSGGTKNSSSSNLSSPNSSSSNLPGTSSSRSTSSDDEPDTEKRSLHNNMERQRRIELRNAFEELRVLVPEVQMKEKAPKVVILRQAAAYCDMLTEIGQNTVDTVNELKRQQDKLRTRLSQLRRNLRSERRGAEVFRNSTSHNNHHQRQRHLHHLQHHQPRGLAAGLQG